MINLKFQFAFLTLNSLFEAKIGKTPIQTFFQSFFFQITAKKRLKTRVLLICTYCGCSLIVAKLKLGLLNLLIT